MICCVTGHRPKGFPFEYNTNCPKNMEYKTLLELEIRYLICCGYTKFISGMAEGADMDFAKSVLNLRDEYEFVSLEAALPHPFAMPKNPTDIHFDKKEILEQCDSVTEVSLRYYRGCMQKRNRYMVDKADLVLAIWNGEKKGGTWDTINYAQSKAKNIRYIMLDKIESSQNIVDKKTKK